MCPAEEEEVEEEEQQGEQEDSDQDEEAAAEAEIAAIEREFEGTRAMLESCSRVRTWYHLMQYADAGPGWRPDGPDPARPRFDLV